MDNSQARADESCTSGRVDPGRNALAFSVARYRPGQKVARSARCTLLPGRFATPTGRRSSPYMTSSSASTRGRSSPSTGHSRCATRRTGGGTGDHRPARRQVGRLSACHATRADLLRRLGQTGIPSRHTRKPSSLRVKPAAHPFDAHASLRAPIDTLITPYDLLAPRACLESIGTS